MPTITVKLDQKRAARLARWARRGKIAKSEVIRALIDRAGTIAPLAFPRVVLAVREMVG